MKLIRDNVPDITLKGGKILEVKTLNDDEFRVAVREKLLEESKEVVAAENKDELTKELADVLELVHTIAKSEGVTFGEVEAARIKKLEIAGGFEKKLLLVTD